MKFIVLFFSASMSGYLLGGPQLHAQNVIAEKQPSAALASVGVSVYHVPRSDGTIIRCYLSGSVSGKDPVADDKLPLLVNVDGSGAVSAFRKQDDRINGGMSGYLASVVQGRAHVLVVEKPGIELFTDHQKRGTVEGASREFLENYTLEYLTQSHVEAVQAVLKLPHVNEHKLLLFGISDGGQLAAEVSVHLPETTHVAALACGGPTQIFDFVLQAGRRQPGDKPGDAQKRVEAIYQRWDEIGKDPSSIEKFWSGHPYRRWSSFCSQSTTDALLKTKAEIYVAHGTADQAVPVESFDVLVSTLRTKGKTLVAERLDGLTHNFEIEGDTSDKRYEPLDQLISRIIQWWL